MDVFNVGKVRQKYYPENTKYVLLQEQNFLLNNVITKIAKTFSNANFTDENEKSELLDKLNAPNNYQSKQEFLKEFAINIMSAGYTFVWKRYVSFGNFKTLELINLSPDKTQIDNDKVVTEYGDVVEKISLSDVIIFYDIKVKTTTKYGYSRITPLKSQIENVTDAQKAKGIQIENSGTTIVSPKQTAAGNNIDEGLNAPVQTLGGMKTQKTEMEDRFNFRGLENRVIVASKGLDAVNLSSELNSVKFHEIVETDILAVYDAFGFPIELTPYGKNATFENKETAEYSLIENEIIPLALNLIHSLNNEFPTKGKIHVDYNHLSSMSIIQKRIQDTNGTIITQLKTLLDGGVISIAEFKKILITKKILE